MVDTELQDALKYAEDIIETVRESMLVLDSTLKVLTANRSFYTTFKVIPAETIDHFIYDLGNRQWDIPKLRLLLEEILPRHSVFNDYEVEHDFQGIGRRTILLNARQIIRKDGGSHIILLAMRDVTERRQGERALLERNRELTCLYQITTLLTLPDITLDELFFKTVSFLQAAMRYPETAGVCIVFDGQVVQTPGFREAPWMLTRAIAVNGKPVGRVVVCPLEEWHADGEEPFLLEEGNLLGAIAEKLGLNIARRRQQKVLQSITDSASDAIMMMNPQGAISFWNPAASEMFGYHPDEVMGKHLHTLLVPERFRNSHDVAYPGFLLTGYGNAIGKTIEISAMHKDGGEIAAELSLSAVFLDEGWHAVGIIRDITEKKRAMEQLIHAQKMESVGELAGGLAHDLNNILTVINGYATLAQLETDRDQDQFSYTQQILRATSQAATLTRNLLVYSRKQEVDPHPQNLNSLIETVGLFIKMILPENILFTLSLQVDPLVANVDTAQLEQVFLNLATNGRDAMSGGGTFTISTSERNIDEQFISTHGYGTIGRYAKITVSDSGHGMDAETKLHIFDPFFTTKEIGKGTGLGLAMSDGIIRQHGGFIDLQSTSGEGTAFHLYIPLVKSAVAEVVPKEIRTAVEKESGVLMIVEDDESTRIALEEFLRRVGYTVVVAVDGQDAVEKFAARKDEIQLVISDVVMPRKSGREAYHEIRQLSGQMKFIFVTGHADDVVKREGELPADAAVIMKPVMPFVLQKKIKQMLELPNGENL